MRKILCFLILSVCLLLVSGCHDNGKIKVTIGMWPESHLTEDVGMFNEWKRLFEEDYPEYEIIGKPYTYTFTTFLPLAQSGTVPTVFQTWFTEPEKLVKNGYVKDITNQLQTLGWYDKMDVNMRNALTFNGKVYGVPRDGYGLGLFINLEIFEEVGLVDDWNDDGVLDIIDEDGNPRYPTTLDELANTAKLISDTMRDTERDVTGLVILSANNNGGWQFSNLAWNFGAQLQVKNSQGKWEANLNDPGAVAALEWIKMLRWDYEAIPVSASLSYSDWYSYVGTGKAAMAFAGNDAISLPITNFEMNKDNIAFVPMPAGTGSNGKHYSLFGGTPYMFSARATDKQVEGALRFLEYMGRSPETSDISISSMRLGMQVADRKGMPILPTIKPWINDDYLNEINNIETQYVNVKMSNFNDFYNSVMEIRKPEEPFYCQEMYSILDSVIQNVLTNQNAIPANLLATADATFQSTYMDRLS